MAFTSGCIPIRDSPIVCITVEWTSIAFYFYVSDNFCFRVHRKNKSKFILRDLLEKRQLFIPIVCQYLLFRPMFCSRIRVSSISPSKEFMNYQVIYLGVRFPYYKLFDNNLHHPLITGASFAISACCGAALWLSIMSAKFAVVFFNFFF